MSNSIGSECSKEECEGTEFECACQTCEKEEVREKNIKTYDIL